MTEAASPRLHAPGPKRILALDGGGTRGIVAIAFLEEIERQLADATGRSVSLARIDLRGRYFSRPRLARPSRMG